MELLTEKAICAAHGCNLENCDCRADCELLVDTRKVAQAQRKKCAEWLMGLPSHHHKNGGVEIITSEAVYAALKEIA